jgi:hypothetical protein
MLGSLYNVFQIKNVYILKKKTQMGTFLQDETPCGLVDGHQCFKGACQG